MKAFYSDHIAVPLPLGHRFPMPKYTLLRKRLLVEGILSAAEIQPAQPASDEQILRAHQTDYFQRVINGELSEKEIRRIGFPWSEELVLRSRHSVGGTILACRAALDEGIAVNLAGGTHHAYADHGEGFCVFNDVAVAVRALQAESLTKRILVLDCDVHQGNGTASIFDGDPSVFTFSIHGQKNFPYHKHPSDLDIGLPDDSGDQVFLEALQSGLQQALPRAQADLAIYIAGADPFIGDRLGRLSLTKDGLAQRDRLVLETCRGAGLPLAIVMGGGYARQVQDTVDIHFKTIRLAAALFEQSMRYL
jgi:acetoin utilization deacetylase AcuC-like enzyme